MERFGDNELKYIEQVFESGRFGWHTGTLAKEFERLTAAGCGSDFVPSPRQKCGDGLTHGAIIINNKYPSHNAFLSSLQVPD